MPAATPAAAVQRCSGRGRGGGDDGAPLRSSRPAACAVPAVCAFAHNANCALTDFYAPGRVQRGRLRGRCVLLQTCSPTSARHRAPSSTKVQPYFGPARRRRPASGPPLPGLGRHPLTAAGSSCSHSSRHGSSRVRLAPAGRTSLECILFSGKTDPGPRPR